MYNSFQPKSFSRNDKKITVYGVILYCLILVLLFCYGFKPHLSPLPNAMNLQNSMGGVGLKMQPLKYRNTSHQLDPKTALPEIKPESLNKDKEVVCVKEVLTEFCEINTGVRVDSNSTSVLVESDSFASTVTIRPYPRKADPGAIRSVRKWSVLPSDETPRCTRDHTVPAVLFSVSGFVGNNFHEFVDVIIPLFIASRRFNGEVQFLLTNYNLYFVKKFDKVLKCLSNYEPIDIDKESNQVHCFPSAMIGFKRNNKELAIDPAEFSTSTKEFRELLRSSYSLDRAKAIRIEKGNGNLQRKEPHLMILSRMRTRAFTNTDEIREMARSLGFKVTVMEASSNLESYSKIVNSCDVLVGIHGAGLSNILFLPENAVLIQVFPFGDFEWMGKADYGLPAIDMKLSYLEYKISKEESSLINQYPLDHEVFTDPDSFKKRGWEHFRPIFMDKQDVKLDVNRFKPTLVKALELLPM